VPVVLELQVGLLRQRRHRRAMEEGAKRPIIIIRKKADHGGHPGGAWKVAYADFVTAMMALFIVLWLLNTSQKTKEAISGYFQGPSGHAKQVGAQTKEGATSNPAVINTTEQMKELQKKLEAAVKTIPNFDKMKANIEMKLTDEGLKIELLENSKGIFFESGKPEPSEVGKQVLIALSKEIGKIPNRVSIEGHTDATPYGSDTYSNWNLSSDRANQARKLMENDGLAANQVSQIRGFADQALRNPKNPTDPTNRRVSLIVQYAGKAPFVQVSSNIAVKEPEEHSTASDSHGEEAPPAFHGNSSKADTK
jgi:chemotaxis protein MotB